MLLVCIVIILCMYVEKKGWELGEFCVELSLCCDVVDWLVVYWVLYVSVLFIDV